MFLQNTSFFYNSGFTISVNENLKEKFSARGNTQLVSTVG
jgi:hypothetical protein